MTKLNYFKDCTTQDEAKNLFKKLCFDLHPDHNQSPTAHAEFIAMREEYANFKPTSGRERTEADSADALYNIVKRFESLNNVLVTFVGSFIWLEDAQGFEGSTRAQKEQIKKILLDGYNAPRFAFKRKKWYFSPIGYKQKFRSKKTFEEIKATWGNTTYKPKEQTKLNFAQ